ncbi:MFS transporter [Kamptonema animale CS-326]|uniref:MFS transporter n=1 Tax=Kamptonema animale TaxID=92934 RepID=UPI00232AE032|nr:MFS transporter [Kamptonema animale]MDB9515204.1 MFS transporter [Kamptonema animale CS-326]
MNVFSTLDPQRRRSLQMLFIAGLLFWCSLGSLLPTLPLYVQYVGGTNQQIGLVMGAFAIGLLLSRPWLGPMADTRGRKLVLLVGALVAELAPMGYLFVTSIPLLLVIRAFHGISIAAFSTGYSALVTDLSPEGRRGELIGYMSLITPVGIAIGPAMGGYLQAWVGYAPLFVMSSSLGMLALICTYQVWEPGYIDTSKIKQKSQIKSQKSNEILSYFQMLWNPRVRIPALVLMSVGLVFGAVSTFMPLFLQQTKVNLNPGLFYSMAAIASFAIRLPTGKASDRYGRGIFISGGLVCYALSMVVMCTANSSNAFLLAALFEGIGGGTVVPMMVTLMADRCEPHERGRLFSLCVGGFDLGIAIAGPILGVVAEFFGYRNMFAIACILAIFATILFITKSSKDLPHSLRFSLGQGKDVYALKN